VITDVVGVLIMPWKLLASPDAYIFIWLVGYGGLLGPISGITVVGYWLVRGKATRRARPVQHAWPLGRHRPGGHVGNDRWRGPNIIGLLCSVKMMGGGPDLCDTIYPYSWFTGFVIAALANRLGMRASRFRAVV
jgi:NCS1 family nucleobase:cation symporter-1